MPNPIRICPVLPSGLAAILLVVTGCAHHVKLTVQPTALAVPERKLPLRAAVVADKELEAWKYEFKMMGDTWIFPFGPAIKDTARQVSEQAFESVTMVPSFEEAARLPVDVILRPEGRKAEQSTPVWAWEDVNFVMVVEWHAKDRSAQNTVWLKTITANASHVGGNLFTGAGNQRKLMQKLFDDLSRKTYDALMNAPELRQLRAGGTR